MVDLESGKRVRDVIELLDYDELIKLKKDIEGGGLHLHKLVSSKIKEIELAHKTYCSYCGNKTDQTKTNNYTLVFGPYDFRKKATFCGVDCMESFIEKLKELKNT